MHEGSVEISVPKAKVVSKELPVFYNPVMKSNRDFTVLLLQTLGRKLQICDPLAGSGIRVLRLLKETPEAAGNVLVNDYREGFVKDLKKELKGNKLSSKGITFGNRDANKFMMEQKGFDYVDIDPFGTPNPFLDVAVKKLSRDGILAVTATDTSSLCGSYPNVCKRRYWAKPLRTHVMHEVGLRILIRKVQLLGTQYDKALVPVFSYSKDHYMRIFFLCKKGKKACDNVLKEHGMYEESGPMWLGALGDVNIVKKMLSKGKWLDDKLYGFLKTIFGELQVGTVGFYDMHQLGKDTGVSELPKLSYVLEKVRKKHAAALTHFRPNSIRSTITKKEIEKIIKN
ncbi:MAG: hypothetical protein ACE5FT_07975 [Candidatus Nanoarchaeia archaeon]